MARETQFAPQDGNAHTRVLRNGDDGIVVQREQYVGDIRDYCIARHNEGHHGSRDMKLMASVPVAIVDHYCAVNNITLREFMHNKEHTRRLLNDPAFADFRIAPGKV